MTDADSITYHAGKALVDMNHDQVLQVGSRSNGDGLHVPPQDRVMPHARLGSDGDVAGYDRAGCHENRFMYHGGASYREAATSCTWNQPSTAIPFLRAGL